MADYGSGKADSNEGKRSASTTAEYLRLRASTRNKDVDAATYNAVSPIANILPMREEENSRSRHMLS